MSDLDPVGSRAEMKRLRAELELARKERDSALQDCDDWMNDRWDRAGLEAELEQARSTCPHSNCDAQRWRAALEEIGGLLLTFEEMRQIARDALAGKRQT